MKIEPRFLRHRLHEAALDQLAASLKADGFEIQREASVSDQPAAPRIDLMARRGDETVFYEVSVVGEARPPARRLSALSTAAKAAGAKFKLLIVRPEQGVDVAVDGIEEALRAALEKDPTGELGRLDGSATVVNVHGVEIDRLRAGASGLEVKGAAVVAVAGSGAAQRSFLAPSLIPFTFDVVLAASGRVAEQPPAVFRLNLPAWFGTEDALG